MSGFTKVWWGWLVSGHTPESSPVTIWPLSGGYQVNRRGVWHSTTHPSLAEAFRVGETILNEDGTMETSGTAAQTGDRT